MSYTEITAGITLILTAVTIAAKAMLQARKIESEIEKRNQLQDKEIQKIKIKQASCPFGSLKFLEFIQHINALQSDIKILHNDIKNIKTDVEKLMSKAGILQ